jgi:methanogenic corrinoid protein MtbC1
MDGLRQKLARKTTGQPLEDDEPSGMMESLSKRRDGHRGGLSAELADAVEGQVVPRLLLAHRGQAEALALDDLAWDLDPDVITAFSHHVLSEDVEGLLQRVEALQARGIPLESVYLDVLAPVARHLGDLWNEDLCDFTAVTVGLWRLQQLVRRLSPCFLQESEGSEQGRRALLVPAPGEQHTFGLGMVADFFRRAGWDVWSGAPSNAQEIARIVRGEWFAVVGISVGCERNVEGLASAIHAIRRASRNRSIGVLVGGSVFVEHPEFVALIGADASAHDGRQAVTQAEALLGLLARRC